ncbi:MAG: Rrf2 family transcriptional regulator [Leptolyngbyaceae cyanobacterium bins.59]|nr:Rrf2 family transcriptional regulator [Leptolyngbyaceae cyanobacterium bins.59]
MSRSRNLTVSRFDYRILWRTEYDGVLIPITLSDNRKMVNDRIPSFPGLSAKVEYGLLALIELATVYTQKTPLTIHEITTRQPIPDRYLEHIFTLLRRSGLLQSQRGAKGGYVLAKEPWRITVSEVITLIDGESISHYHSSNANEGKRVISIERDILRGIWQQAHAASQEVFSRYTLQDLCQQRDARQQKPLMYYI